MNVFKRRKILRSISAMDLVPVRVVSHKEEDGKVILLVPKFENRIIHRLFPASEQMFFKIRLDDNGTLAWNSINGESSIEQMLSSILDSEKNNKDISDAKERLLKFISLLYERKFISFRQLLK